MREEKEKKKRGGGFQAGGVGIVMKSGCVKNNKNKREDKDVLSHGGESGDSHADPFRWINIFNLFSYPKGLPKSKWLQSSSLVSVCTHRSPLSPFSNVNL